jgi:putative endopeptidase
MAATGPLRDGMDPEVRPQDDLFGYVNGGWLATAEIPADRGSYGSFHMLRDRAEEQVRDILAEAAAATDSPDANTRKLGTIYGDFLDEERADRLGADPIREDLAAIDEVADLSGFLSLLGRLERGGVPGFSSSFVTSDRRDSTRSLVYLFQGGLGLPDESYYRDDAYAEIRDKYVATAADLLGLAGVEDSRGAAQRVIALESRLADGHWDRVASRDAVKTYNLMGRDALSQLAPDLDWASWIRGLDGGHALDEVVVGQPGFFESVSRALSEVALDDWKAWLRWNLVRAAAPYLSGEFVHAHFELYGRTLSGVPELKERWKRGVEIAEAAMGEAIGQIYVARHFPPESKQRMLELVDNLVEAYRRDIERLDWMGPQTRQRALEKLSAFRSKIGYPDRWRDYSALEIQPDDLVGNLRRAAAFEHDRQLAKVAQPIDRDEWLMTPQTVNAYYNAGMNEIVFPAAILQPPAFDPEADDAVNYGGIGAVIGHEIGHGFDDQGSRYDGAGNLSDWWEADDRERFTQRADSLIAQYDAFEPRLLPGHHINGALTVGENIGDLGGVTVAHQAYLLSLDGHDAPVINDTTGSQRVFMGWAKCWRSKARDAEALRLLAIDPHSPAEFRANVVRNLTEFYDAFDVGEGDGLWLAPADRVRIW